MRVAKHFKHVNKNNMGNTKQDRSRVAKLQPHEIQTLKRKFKTDKATVLEAISLAKTPTGRPTKNRKWIEIVLKKLIADRFERL
jgi:hypothetical protein